MGRVTGRLSAAALRAGVAAVRRFDAGRMSPLRVALATASGVLALVTGVLGRGHAAYSPLLAVAAVVAALVAVAGGLLAVRIACGVAAGMVGVIDVVGQYQAVPGFGATALAAAAVFGVLELGVWAADLGLRASWDRGVLAQRGGDIVGLAVLGLIGAVAVGAAGEAGRGQGAVLLLPAVVAAAVLLWLVSRASRS
jgi:hypothetical protein